MRRQFVLTLGGPGLRWQCDATTMVAVLALLATATASLAAGTPPDDARTVRLSALLPSFARQAWGTLGVDHGMINNRLKVGERALAHGLGTSGDSELEFDLDGEYERFEAWVGVDAAMIPHKAGSVEFIVLGDGRELFRSGVMRVMDPPKRVSVSVTGVTLLRLVATVWLASLRPGLSSLRWYH